MTLLKKIKEKPDHIKHRIAIGSTAFIMSVIFSVWIATVDLRFSEDVVALEKPSPMNILKTSLGNIYSSFDWRSIGGRLSEIKENYSTIKGSSEDVSVDAIIIDTESSVIIESADNVEEEDVSSEDGLKTEESVI